MCHVLIYENEKYLLQNEKIVGTCPCVSAQICIFGNLDGKNKVEIKRKEIEVTNIVGVQYFIVC